MVPKVEADEDTELQEGVDATTSGDDFGVLLEQATIRQNK